MPNDTPLDERLRRHALVIAAVTAGHHTLFAISRHSGLAQSPMRSAVVRLCLSKSLRRVRSSTHRPSGPVWVFHLPLANDQHKPHAG